MATLAALAANDAFPFVDVTEALELVTHEVKFERLPKEFDGYRIGFATDLHLGVNISADFIEHALLTLHTAAVDLLVLGGDYIWIPESFLALTLRNPRSPEYDNSPTDEVNRKVFTKLSEICATITPPDGTVAILGNHDRWSHPNEVDTVFRASKDIILLENEEHLIKRGDSSISLVGVADYLTGIPFLPSSFNHRSQFSILIAHNPDYICDMAKVGELPFDFALSGHTHGGQFTFPLIGAPYCNVADRRFLQGFVELQGKPIYVSRGVGVVEIPYRIGVRPEVTVFTLRC
jgi:predicted MPP superfamily phosphohydrolase